MPGGGDRSAADMAPPTLADRETMGADLGPPIPPNTEHPPEIKTPTSSSEVPCVWIVLIVDEFAAVDTALRKFLGCGVRVFCVLLGLLESDGSETD